MTSAVIIALSVSYFTALAIVCIGLGVFSPANGIGAIVSFVGCVFLCGMR